MFGDAALILSFAVCLLMCVCEPTEVLRPRGVSLTKSVFYKPDIDFSCLDGSAVIPFGYVNDDFCDCKDGSDEPGTPACPNGIFHCTNAGHRPLNIPSSRVNDGICDCCDASDEYNSTTQCVSNCRDLGRKAREDALRQAEIVAQGYQIRTELSKEGKRKIEEHIQQLDELSRQKEEADAVKAEKEARKTVIEELEKAALDKYKSEEEEKKKAEEELENAKRDQMDAANAFADLDSNQDGKITIDEIQVKWVFDSNKDGIVTEEEAKVFLQGKDEYTNEEFLTIGWMIIKPHYSMLNLFKQPGSETNEYTTEGGGSDVVTEATDTQTEPVEEGPYDDDDEEDGELESEDTAKVPESPESDEVTEDDTKPVYDEETQKLIDAASSAREEFNEANKRASDLEIEVRKLKETLEIDFGEDQQFFPFYKECFEFTDREYTYKLCMFEQVTQKPKSGGSDINLGRWDQWAGPEDNKYSAMKYSNGLSCWNGPTRSTEVRLLCGRENKILSVAEPNRCIYVFEAETPAMCVLSSKDETLGKHEHEEL